MDTKAKVNTNSVNKPKRNYLRFHLTKKKLNSQLDDWFAVKAESFARFFGTPIFIAIQTVIVAIWITLNILKFSDFDPYPFILLNLAFSLQAAYAAPLILLAQTRQSDREKAYAEADAEHREELAQESLVREQQITEQNKLLIELMKKNTELTELTQQLSSRIEKLTSEVHQKITQQ